MCNLYSLNKGQAAIIAFTRALRDSTGKARGGNVWFALDETRPLAVFASIHVPSWTSVRKVKEGPTTNDLFGFLTCDPNGVVAPSIRRQCRWFSPHPKKSRCG
jgi:putative SOS response-associated peptidase YedK